MLFLLCPHPVVLCSLSATTFHCVPETPRPPVTPDLKPKMVGGAGQTRDRGCSGWASPPSEDEALI